MNAKDFMKIAGVKNEKEFYKKYPTEEAFFEAFPDAMQYKKGGKIKKKKQDPAHGYREFPPNVMAMGGGLVNMMQGGGSIPNMPLAQEGMESTAQSGYISPYNESQFNTTQQAKKTGQVMSRGENVGWTIADVVFDFFAPIHGQDVDLSKMTGKVNPYNAQQGSWWKTQGGGGGMNSSIMNKMMSSGQGKGENPAGGTAPGAAPGAEDLTTSVGMGNSMGTAMVKYGGPLKMNMGGQMMPNSMQNSSLNPMGLTAINSPEELGTSLRQYGGDLKFQMGGNMPQGTMGLNELMGPTHEEGGMAISPEVEVEGGETILEPESYVFSDSIQVPGKKKTFAQESKAIKNKYKLRPNDKLSKESSEAELETLMNLQEETKATMMAKDQERFQNKMMMKYGGLMPAMQYPVDRNMQPVQMYDGGGIRRMGKRKAQEIIDFQNNPMFEDPANYGNIELTGNQLVLGDESVDFKNPRQARRFYNTLQSGALGNTQEEIVNPVESNLAVTETIVPNTPSYIPVSYPRTPIANPILNTTIEDPYSKETTQRNRLKSLFDDKDMKEEQISRIFGDVKYDLTNPNVTKDSQTDDKKRKFDPNMLRIPNSAIAGLAAAAKGLGKQRLYLTPQAAVNYLNTRPAEVLAERQGELALAAGLGGLKDNATTQGNYLANVANLASSLGIGTGANVANIRFQGDTSNIGISNQAALQRQATIAANNAARTRKETADLLRRDKTIDDFYRTAATASTDAQKKQQQQYLLEAMARGIAKVDKNGRIMYKSTDEEGNSEWVYASELG